MHGIKADLRHKIGDGMASLGRRKKTATGSSRSQKLVSHLSPLSFLFLTKLAAIMSKPVTIKIKNGNENININININNSYYFFQIMYANLLSLPN